MQLALPWPRLFRHARAVTKPRRRPLRRLGDLAVFALLLVALWLPTILSCFSAASSATLSENRPVAPSPPLTSLRDLVTFPRRYEAYFNDHFGGRHRLIRWHNLVKFHWLGMSGSSRVLVGKDGWLFYNPLPKSAVPLHPPPLSATLLERWRELLEGRRRQLAGRGIHYLVVFAPDKESIYPEQLPGGGRPAAASTPLDQLLAHLRDHSATDVLDLRPCLRQAKGSGPLYLRTDTHWNGRGVYVAYDTLLRNLARFDRSFHPWPPSAFETVVVERSGGDLAIMLGLSDQLSDEDVYLQPRHPRQARPTFEAPNAADEHRLAHLRPVVFDGGRGPRGVFLFDSFGEPLAPFLGEHFSRLVCLPSYGLDLQRIDRERPSIVIQQLVERKLVEWDEGRLPRR
ncbi:MAG: hypothetical protein NZ700_00400 [Gemmataceae bacterium]|nr:hypothetical protein [Gemmataceae bacterium]MDW8265438.1 hypothetical protein [Gemmataceae bacterium]